MKASTSAKASVGLITYMRTDSVTLAEEALRELRAVIAERYGKDNLPDEPRRYTTKAKNAQEAHEAIRPTSRVARARGRAPLPRPEPVQALRADLEAHGRLADESGRLRHGRGRPRRGRVDDGRHRVPRDGLRARRARASSPSIRKAATTRSTTSRTTSCPPSQKATGARCRDIAERAALHRAAAALLRSHARQGARGVRHRPPVDVRVDHLDAAEPRVRRDGQPPLHPDRRRPRRQPIPHAVLLAVRRLRLHRANGGRRSTRSRAAKREWVPLLEKFWKPFSKLVEHTETNGHARAGVAGARARHRSRERPAHERAHGPLRRVRADRHEGRRGQADVRGPASRPEDGHDHARRRARSVQAAARSRHDAGGRAGVGEHRPLRPVRSLRGEVRVDPRRRSRTRSRSSARSS